MSESVSAVSNPAIKIALCISSAVWLVCDYTDIISWLWPWPFDHFELEPDELLKSLISRNGRSQQQFSTTEVLSCLVASELLVPAFSL